jgi:hypothetical protein
MVEAQYGTYSNFLEICGQQEAVIQFWSICGDAYVPYFEVCAV